MCPRETMLEIHGVVPVKIRPRWDTKRIAGPHRACGVVCGQSEWVCVLTEPDNDSVLGQRGLHAEVLRLKNDRVRCSVE